MFSYLSQTSHPSPSRPSRATSLADLIGVDFALINRNRKREQNKRIRAAQRSAKGILSTQSSFSDLRSGLSTPMEASLASLPPQGSTSTSASRSTSMSTEDNGGIPRSISDDLGRVSLDSSSSALEVGNGNGTATGSRPQLSQIANGVHQNESGEWVVHDEDGRRITSGGSRSRERRETYKNPIGSNFNSNSTSNIREEEQKVNEDDGEEETKMEILVGDVAGKVAILVDDMVDTGRTLALAAKTLEDAGAAKVYAIISHGLLSGKSVDLIKKLCLEKLVVSFKSWEGLL